MATKLSFDQLKGQIERLRKDSLEVVANANRIVYGGVQKLADKELKALNDYYKSAVSSIKAARRGESSVKDAAQKQFDLLQDTVNQVIGHARESVGVIAETRAELAKLVQNSAKGAKISEKALDKAIAPAKKALSKVRDKAEAAGKQASKVVKTAQKDAKREAKKLKSAVKKEAKAVEAKAGKVAKTVVADARAGVTAAKKAVNRVAPSPSLNSRASRATSRAKAAVAEAVDTATTAVNNAVTAVVDAVKTAG